MAAWSWLLNILILLVAALVLGTLAEQLRQNSIIGYLLAGMLVGPRVLGLVSSVDEVKVISELGVSLLLFSIGLEFSFKRLTRLGPITFYGGTAQILLTALAGYAVSSTLGLEWRASVVLGFIFSLSSTACVLRVLIDETTMESLYGRNSLGILLLQDLAVVPFALVTLALGGESTVSQSLWTFGRIMLLGGGMIAGFYLVFNLWLPKLLKLRSWTRNRELPILLAIVLAFGSSWAAHQVQLSPSFGAFLAGLLLGESPFAVQIRADIASLRTVLVTLFFASIGMLVDPLWAANHWLIVSCVVAMVVLAKPLIVWAIMRVLGHTNGPSIATGLCLAQIGEFSFVLAEVAGSGGILQERSFMLIISAAFVTLVLTPYLVRAAPLAGQWAELNLAGRKIIPPGVSAQAAAERDESIKERKPIIIIGFGPAGRRVAETLLPHYQGRLIALDLNNQNSIIAESYGIEFHIGNACQSEVLEHLGIRQASAVVITVPDPGSSRQVIHLCRFLAPEVKIIARARYHVSRWYLLMAGAERVVDEEDQVGQRLAQEVLEAFEE